MLCCAVLRCAARCCAGCCAVLRRAAPCRAVPWRAVPRRAVPCRVAYAVLQWQWHDGQWYLVKTAKVESQFLYLLIEKQCLICGMCICSLLPAKEDPGQLRVELPQGQGLL